MAGREAAGVPIGQIALNRSPLPVPPSTDNCTRVPELTGTAVSAETPKIANRFAPCWVVGLRCIRSFEVFFCIGSKKAQAEVTAETEGQWTGDGILERKLDKTAERIWLCQAAA